MSTALSGPLSPTGQTVNAFSRLEKAHKANRLFSIGLEMYASRTNPNSTHESMRTIQKSGSENLKKAPAQSGWGPKNYLEAMTARVIPNALILVPVKFPESSEAKNTHIFASSP